ILVGIFAGPNQSASRSLMGRFVPPEKESEFYGFFAFSGKATSFLGPFLFGNVTILVEQLFAGKAPFAPQRAGIAVLIVLLALGWILLRRVDEEEGMALAKIPDETLKKNM
ncbi:MAG TPA: MFS transporter, partial [Rhodothermales bacterium]|nr:MFS transporter [Rhodothermales bacterium]